MRNDWGAEDLRLVGRGGKDPSVLVRKQALDTAAALVRQFPAAAEVSAAWLQLALPLAGDADPSVKACAISGEKFHTFYNDGDDQWHVRDALRLKSPYQGVAAGSYVLRSSLPPEIRERELS